MSYNFSSEFNRPIITESVKERQDKLEHKIAEIGIFYADHLYQSKKETEPKPKFSEILEQETAVLSQLKNRVYTYFEDDQKKTDETLRVIYDEIDSLYQAQADNWQELIFKKIQQAMDQYEKKSDEKEIPTEGAKEKAGMLEFNLQEQLRDAEKLGFDIHDQFIQIHFEDFYKNKDASFDLEKINDSLRELAKQIAQKYPQARAVIGISWLLEHPLVSYLEFKTVPDYKVYQNDFSTWAQFVDRNGQINQKRLDYLKEHGRPPYRSTLGYIPVEDFLQKYLPEEMKKEVKLKILNPAWKEKRQRITVEAAALKKDLSGHAAPPANLDRHLNKEYPQLMELFRSTGVNQEAVEMARGAYGKSMEELDSSNIFRPLEEKLKEYFSQDKYIEKPL